MIETIMLAFEVTLIIVNGPISCNGVPIDFGDCTYYDARIIYVTEFNSCLITHGYNEHILKKNIMIHYGVCSQW